MYDVTTWTHSTNPALTRSTDIGALINDIIADITPSGATPTIILVASGTGHQITNNHAVSNVAAMHVVLDAATHAPRVLDSATSAQFLN